MSFLIATPPPVIASEQRERGNPSINSAPKQGWIAAVATLLRDDEVRGDAT